jgi:hypothetical protein
MIGLSAADESDQGSDKEGKLDPIRQPVDENGDGEPVVVSLKRKRNTDPKYTVANFLSGKRAKMRALALKGLLKLHTILVKQREHFVQYHPIPPIVTLSGNALAEAKEKLEKAYARLRETEALFVENLAEIRSIEASLSADLNDQPALFALGVSAPGTTWGTDEWNGLTPLPEVTACLRRVVVAAYSPPAKERRLKGYYGIGCAKTQRTSQGPVAASAVTPTELGGV